MQSHWLKQDRKSLCLLGKVFFGF